MTQGIFRVLYVTLLTIVVGFVLPATPRNYALGQTPSDESVLRTIIERYFAAYASKDVDGMVRLWSDKSPDLEQGKARWKEFFSLNKKIEITNLSLSQLQTASESATTLVTIEVSAIDEQTDRPARGLGKQSRTLSFVKEGGAWRISRDVLAEEELASRLVAAKSDEERKTILDQQRPLVDVALQKSLVEQADRLRANTKYAESLTVFELARQVAIEINDQAAIAEISNYLGNVFLAQGKRDLAMESYQKGLKLCTDLGQKVCIAAALLGIGNTHEAKLNHELAIEFLKKALTINEELEKEPGITRALVLLGGVYINQGNYPQALEAYLKALPIAESAGNTQRLAVIYRNIGYVQRMRGEAAASIESSQKSAVLYEKLGDKRGVAAVTTALGIVHSQRGDYRSAMRYFQQCLEVYEKLGDKKGVFDSLGNIGIVQRLQGNYSLALEYQQKSLALSEADQDSQGVAHSLNNIGIIYNQQGDYPRALEAFQKSLKLNETLGNKSEVASVFNNMGVTYRNQGAFDLALETFRKSLEIRDRLGEKGAIANLLRSMAIAYDLKGDSGQAILYSTQAANLAKEIGFREVLSGALTTSGKVHLALGETEKSRTEFEEAIATVEALRSQVAGGAEDQQRFFEGMVSPYYRMVELNVTQGNLADALSYAEQGKARLLLDVLKSGRTNITKAMTPVEREQERKIRDSAVLLNTQISAENRRQQPDQKVLIQLKAQLEKARFDQQDFQVKLFAAHPDLQIQRGETPRFGLPDSRALIANSNTALLEYVVMDDRTYLFVVSMKTNKADAEVAVYSIPIKRSELATQVESFRAKVASHNLLIRESARQVYDLLLKPAQTLLQNKANLIIVPDDVLWELPFQALVTESNHYLIEQSAISYTPSLTVLREMLAKRRGHHLEGESNSSLLALGNPALGQATIEPDRTTRDQKLAPLPEAEREVQTLAKLYGASRSEVLIGTEAREDRAKNDAGKFRVLHFATHGIVNNSSPMYSYLVLSQGDSKEDGLLEAWELLNMDLRADLVVLSACETARGRVGAGEGMIGLSWALFVAGTPTTVVSQWKVDSASTTDLMLEFHRNLLEPNSKAQSLRKAMLKMLNTNQYKHPFYWAPFVVIGDAN